MSRDYGDWFEAESRAERANELVEAHRWEEALTELDVAVRINPDNAAWHVSRGRLLDELRRYSEAIDAYRDALMLEAGNIECLTALGIDFARVGDYAQSLSCFEQLEQIDPSCEAAYCHRVFVYSALGEHDKAEQMFYLARQLSDFCPICYYNMGVSQLARADYERALYCFGVVQEHAPNYPQINQRRAESYWRMGDYHHAQQEFLEELRTDPRNIDALVQFSYLLMEMGRMDQAAEKLRRVVEMEPDHTPARRQLAMMAYQSGEFPQAAEQYEFIVRQHPECSETRTQLARVYGAMEQWGQARRQLEEALQIDDEQPEVLLDLSEACMMDDDAGSGQRYLEQLEKMLPYQPEIMHKLAVCHFMQDHWDEGIECCQKALDIDQTYMPALHKLAVAYIANEQWSQARQTILRALEIEPSNESFQGLLRQLRVARVESIVHHALHPVKSLRRCMGTLFGKTPVHS
jgi:superkiller protein 3